MTVTNTDTLAKDVVNTFLKAMNEEDYRFAVGDANCKLPIAN